MLVLQIALKLIGLSIIPRVLFALLNLISIIVQRNFISSVELVIQITIFLLYLTVSILLIITPKWMVSILGKNIDNNYKTTDLAIIEFHKWLEIGIILIGFYLFMDGMIKVISYILRYAIVFNSSNSDIIKRIRAEAITKIDALISVIAGAILIKNANSAKKIVGLKKDRTEEI